jgi:anaerobic glycerol-3-phosphate dehydrogenase
VQHTSQGGKRDDMAAVVPSAVTRAQAVSQTRTRIAAFEGTMDFKADMLIEVLNVVPDVADVQM